MSSDGEDLSDRDDSGDGFMVGGEVECEEADEEEEVVGGDRVARVLHAGAQLGLVCIYSGCNRVILVDADEVDEYVTATNKFLRTAQADASVHETSHRLLCVHSSITR